MSEVRVLPRTPIGKLEIPCLMLIFELTKRQKVSRYVQVCETEQPMGR